MQAILGGKYPICICTLVNFQDVVNSINIFKKAYYIYRNQNQRPCDIAKTKFVKCEKILESIFKATAINYASPACNPSLLCSLLLGASLLGLQLPPDGPLRFTKENWLQLLYFVYNFLYII